ncbi:hypothetical protein PHMEG_0007310 [Phytophthora megakarya]|uniref:Uncharacterized protein n=1 Tax=Phytophthora megakarya TaxID=4795 RepID=A0A225WNZ3_9STRA|nr:hypothetical protein PHMEG_0007310 [Phytophthora megakarya]
MPKRVRLPLPVALHQELNWFHFILKHGAWDGLPTSMFCSDPPIDIHWSLDASDSGLAVVDSAQQRFIQLQFDVEESTWIHTTSGGQPFTINVR